MNTAAAKKPPFIFLLKTWCPHQIGLLHLPDTGVTTHEQKAAMFCSCFRLFISRWTEDILWVEFLLSMTLQNIVMD